MVTYEGGHFRLSDRFHCIVCFCNVQSQLQQLDCVIVVVVVVEMDIINVALSHFCCRTTVQSDSVSVARQVTVRRW